LANKSLLMALIMAVLGILVFVMLFTLLQYASSSGFHSILESLPSIPTGDFFSSGTFASIMLFASAFVVTIGVLALLTHGAIIKAAKKFVAAYVAVGVILFVAMGVAGMMIALVTALITLMVLWQFALKNVMFRTPASGPEENIGSEGTVVDDVDDEGENGRVRVGDTIWWAVSSDGSIIEKGEKVRVEGSGNDKLTLRVRRAPAKGIRQSPKRRCPYCGQSIPREATFCPVCGKAIQ